jgi:3-phosphoshikimate 1-carboxyvinyltransferase
MPMRIDRNLLSFSRDPAWGTLLTDFIEIPTCGPIDADIRPPGSKSITNRALVCSSLASGRSVLSGALRSEDTEVMVSGLRSLGIEVQADWSAGRISIEGCAGALPARRAVLHLRNSGTSIRFLTAVCATGNGQFTLDGSTRMRQRPIGDLVDALNHLGGKVRCQQGFPPVEVEGCGLIGGTSQLRCNQSSQFLSALLMVLPCTGKFSVVQVDGRLVSRPYVEMTCRVMGHFGVDVTRLHGLEYSVDPRHVYRGRLYQIEPDASAASYFWAAAAITGGRCRVDGLTPDSMQGDVRFVQVLGDMGCEIITDDTGMAVSGGSLRGVEVDMNDISDTVQTLAAVALFAEGHTVIKGVAHIRHKETDRIGNLAIELRKLGADVREHEDGLTIVPGPLRPAVIETWDDHRMAMALSLAGLRQPGVVIRDPACTGKTYPDFFRDLQRVSGKPWPPASTAGPGES